MTAHVAIVEAASPVPIWQSTCTGTAARAQLSLNVALRRVKAWPSVPLTGTTF